MRKILKTNSSIKYRPEVDGCRGLAISLVILFHYFPRVLSGGFVGVDVFFVISGYLITSLIIIDLNTNSFSFFNFYFRRIRRIFPSLVTVIFCCIIGGWFALTLDEFSSLGKYVAWSSVFLSNFLLLSEHGYFDVAAVLKPFLHLWSLAIEEQFYLIWPFFLFTIFRYRFGILFLAILVGGSYFLNVHNIKTNPSSDFYMPFTRFWELGIGSILSWAQMSRDHLTKDALLNFKSIHLTRPANEALGLIGLALILFSAIFFSDSDAFPGKIALLPTLGTALLIGSSQSTFLGRKIFASRLPVLLGKVSYPLYLWHWPLLSFMVIMSGDRVPAEVRFVVMLVALTLSILTYRLIEIPCRFHGSLRKNSGILILSMAILGLTGLYINQKSGSVLGKFDPINPWQGTSPFGGVTHDRDCDEKFPQFSKYHRCLVSKENSAPNIVIIGDSHSAHFYSALAEKYSNQNVMNIDYQGCLPFTGTRSPECAQAVSETYNFLTTSSSIHTVYLAGFWHHLLVGGFIKDVIGGGILNHWSENYASNFEHDGFHLIKRLLDSGKNVVFIRDIPDLDFFPSECIHFRPVETFWKVREPCAMDRRNYEAREAQADQLITKLLAQYPEVKVLNPRDLLCDKNYCYAIMGGKLLYHDRHHLSLFGSRYLIEHMK
ncbi:acyltransferase family protein [Paludibacterium purpuratum]|uniref:Peptidoglycan/LPS O-acetylase OafA/YrhL n=1 Tax=Paludibacterium purpuratum TaxID=1144873 RepID=A0A4R7B2A8_9NEIS|nr:acyltransferase family protein [Paludibacterium purpuratum]TDR77868.1 peptidoglycan/LPS O-acetylase OafA/YrhL [Paludibacterium purpuratum]